MMYIGATVAMGRADDMSKVSATLTLVYNLD